MNQPVIGDDHEGHVAGSANSAGAKQRRARQIATNKRRCDGRRLRTPHTSTGAERSIFPSAATIKSPNIEGGKALLGFVQNTKVHTKYLSCFNPYGAETTFVIVYICFDEVRKQKYQFHASEDEIGYKIWHLRAPMPRLCSGFSGLYQTTCNLVFLCLHLGYPVFGHSVVI
uniref:Reverse transcriptase domain-containing protein n=1 Tax=Steinernema glaseri TaxID=37863 RepID=A0A1I8AJT3_9BILA